jgi:hypothetical protein
MRGEVIEICEATRNTLKKIIESEPIAPPEEEKEKSAEEI